MPHLLGSLSNLSLLFLYDPELLLDPQPFLLLDFFLDSDGFKPIIFFFFQSLFFLPFKPQFFFLYLFLGLPVLLICHFNIFPFGKHHVFKFVFK
jgi:hypothetical protein